MVDCAKCGTKNEDDVKTCVNCGAALHPEERSEKRQDKWTRFAPETDRARWSIT